MIPNRYLNREQYDAYVDHCSETDTEPTRDGFEEWAEANYIRDSE